MDTGLSGRVVIVTGATANIGRAIALAFAKEGVRLAVVGRDRIKGEEVAKLGRESGAADSMFCAADVTDRREVEAMVAAVAARLGPIDVLVNNVGGNTGFLELFADSDPDKWQADIDLNLKSALLCTHAVLPHMLGRKRGRIINIGSTAGEVGDYMLGVYSATKGAIHAFTRALALEVGEQNITVNCVAPYATEADDPALLSSGSRFRAGGVFSSDKADPSRDKTLTDRPDLQAKLLRRGQLPRNFAKPSEIGAATVYLASDSAAFVTGQVHCVDGGALL